jgi:GxxExxY protein
MERCWRLRGRSRLRAEKWSKSEFYWPQKGTRGTKTEQNLMKEIKQLCDIVRETAFAIHCYHRHGHLEKIYENALVNRLRKKGLVVMQQHPLPVYDEDGTLLGDFYADLLIEGVLIVELKACKAVADEHIAQLLGYLRSARIEHGLLLNFGAPRFEIKKYILDAVDPIKSVSITTE